MLESEMLNLYKCPDHPVDVILDTDTYNEMDDQFAIAYLVKSAAKLNVKGFTVAPFFNEMIIKDIPEGLQKSRDEIVKVLNLTDQKGLADRIYIGSEQYIKDENTPIESDAARFIVNASKVHTKSNPLYVVGIGAATNIASAILLDPMIINRICVIWLGGNSRAWCTNSEFNLNQDIAAVRVIMKSEVPFIQIPAMGVISEFITTRYELEHWLKGKNAISDYLCENSIRVAKLHNKYKAWSRVIWDVLAPAWLLNDNNRFMYDRIEKRRLPAYEGWQYEKKALPLKMCYVHAINRDALMDDLFEKLTK